jgi:hypothetical protein
MTIAEPQLNGNGQPKGRTVPDLAIFTFASGATARLRPVSQFTQAHIEIQMRKQHPAPEPPMNTVNPLGAGERLEPNRSDEAYERAVAQHQALISSKVFEATIELGVEIEVDHAKLERVAAVMERIGTPLDEISDKVAYIKHCCMFDIEHEGPLLAEAMRALIGPRAEDVADHIATFPDNVSRA